jgi:hypothetical protein
VPYLDGTEATFEIASPLSNIKFIHFTNDDEHAGFIKPIIQSMDYRKHFFEKFE